MAPSGSHQDRRYVAVDPTEALPGMFLRDIAPVSCTRTPPSRDPCRSPPRPRAASSPCSTWILFSGARHRAQPLGHERQLLRARRRRPRRSCATDVRMPIGLRDSSAFIETQSLSPALQPSTSHPESRLTLHPQDSKVPARRATSDPNATSPARPRRTRTLLSAVNLPHLQPPGPSITAGAPRT